MKDRFEVAKRLWLREDNRPECPTIDGASDPEVAEGLQDRFTKSFENPISARTLFEQDMTDGVGIEAERSQFFESDGGQTLARADAADDANDWYRTVPPGARRPTTWAGFFTSEARHDDSIHARNLGGTRRVGTASHKARTTQSRCEFKERTKGNQVRD
jgi:hypothetical protein